MVDNQQKQAAEILKQAFSPPKPEEAPEAPAETLEAEPTEVLEEESSSSETLQPDESQEESIDTLNSLAETLDIDISDMYALALKMPEGAEPVELGKLKNFYLENKDLEQARQQLENERSVLDAEREKLKDIPQAPQELVQAQALTMQIQQEWNNLEASGLKDSDPGRYSAQALELQNRWTQAQNMLANVGQQVEARRLEKMREGQERLHKLVPDLADDQKREQISNRVSGYIQKYGFSADDLAFVDDPRLMHLIIEASELATKTGKLKDKQVNTAPKVLKPQAVKQSSAGRKAALKRLTEKARSTGQRRDQVNAVSALLRGS